MTKIIPGVLALAVLAGPAAAGDGDPGSRSGWNGGGGARQAGDTFTSSGQGVRGQWVQPSTGISIWRSVVSFSEWVDSWRTYAPVEDRLRTPQRLGYSVSGGSLTRTDTPSLANGWGVANAGGAGWRGY